MTSHSRVRYSGLHHSAAVRGGYTLIELLIAAVLSATLMTVIWGLLSMYNGWLTAGRVQSEERQLRRSLMMQLQEDLEAVAAPDAGRQVQFLESAADAAGVDSEPLPEQSFEDPLALAMEPELEAIDLPVWLQSLGLPNQTRGLPGLSLQGTATLLRLVVPAKLTAAATDTTVPTQAAPAAADPTLAAAPGETAVPVAPADPATDPGAELAMPTAAGPATPAFRIILWQFRPWGSTPATSMPDEFAFPATEPAGIPATMPPDPLQSLPGTGLTRQVWDGTTLLQLSREQNPQSSLPAPDALTELAATSDPLTAAATLDEERIPEAMAVQFEYFDGRRWQSSWNSTAQGGLPVALRLRMWMVGAAAAEKLAERSQQGPAGDSPTDAAADGVSGNTAGGEGTAELSLAEPAIPLELLERTFVLQPISGAMPGLLDGAESLPGVLP